MSSHGDYKLNVRFLGRLLLVVVVFSIALLLTFNVFIDIGPILAGAGILGLAVSFGAQSLVKDVISGFFILFENQFAIGDVIEVASRGTRRTHSTALLLKS